MSANPYHSPELMSPYYSDDITTLPVSAIWRLTRHQGPAGWFLVFPMFLARKLLHQRFRPIHATRRLHELVPIADKDLSPVIRAEFGPLEAACRAAGMEHILTFQPSWIGAKSGIFSIWLHQDGEMYCNLTRIEFRFGETTRLITVFACHSRMTSGVELHTSATASEEWIPELVPPNREMLRLPTDTTPAAVIERHRQRIAARSGLIRFTPESLLEELVRGSQAQFDFLVERGIYVQLTHAEVELLVAKNRPPFV